MIISRTPLRVSFVGGGTDFKNYYKRGYGAVVSTAINKYVYVILNPRFDDLIRLGYSKPELVENVDEIEHDIARESLKLTGVNKGIELIYFADIQIGKAGTGLGSSSALAVGILNALYAYKGEKIDIEILAKQACQIEIDILERPIGKQDQYITAHGGFNHIKFHSDENVSMKPIDLDKEILDYLDKNLLMFYTGIETGSSNVLTEQDKNTDLNISFLDEMAQLTDEIQKILLEKKFKKFGEMLHQNWLYKKQLASKISNNFIDDYYQRGLDAGALGGKILGSGGGGFLLFYCEPENQNNLREELSDLRELEFRFESEGSKIIYKD